MAQILFPNFFVNYKLGPWGLSKLPAHNTNPPKWIQNMQIVGTWLTLIKEAQTLALKLFDQQRKQGYANLGGGEINQLKLPLAEFVLPLAWSITHTSALLPSSSSPSSSFSHLYKLSWRVAAKTHPIWCSLVFTAITIHWSALLAVNYFLGQCCRTSHVEDDCGHRYVSEMQFCISCWVPIVAAVRELQLYPVQC